MDRIAHDIRRSNWLEILKRSQQRPVHTTIKQWYLDNGISEKSYYYWQRKFRQEAGAQVSVPTAVFKYKDLTEYSCAMKSHFRKFGNQMSGSGNHLCNYASLLA